ncbi:MAG: hypothetical protein AAGD01_11905 [Acidobacteriota bacterium]
MNILLLSHGNLACELLDSARKIAGDLPEFTALCLSWGDSPEAAAEKLSQALEAGRQDGWGSLILVDVYGSTPFRTAQGFQRPGEVEIVTGVNLPMVVRLGCLAGKQLSLEETADLLVVKGQKSICRAQAPGTENANGKDVDIPTGLEPCS